MLKDISELKGNIIGMKKDIQYIKYAITGKDGKKGIIDLVNENRDFRLESQARNNFIKAGLGIGWLGTLIFNVVMFFKGGLT